MRSGRTRVPSNQSILDFIASICLRGRCSSINSWNVPPLTCQKCISQTRALQASWKISRLSASWHRPVECWRRSRPLSSLPGASHFSSSSNEDNPFSTARTDLPSHEEGRRSLVSIRFSHVMDHLQSNIFIAGQRLNELTGYSGIEALKREIEEQEKYVRASRSSLQQARQAYSAAINSRSSSQREVNELLQRKHAWTSNDLERFTALYRSDHANEQSESAAQEQLAAAERKAEEGAANLSASILARYHEEQIWSDKIRRMSTWGTWGLMGVNVLLFLVFQIGVEPWKRKRLVKGFEQKVYEALEREASPIGVATKMTKIQTSQNLSTSGALVDGIEKEIDGGVEPDLPSLIENETLDDPHSAEEVLLTNESTTRHRLSGTGTFKDSVRDLFSDQLVVLRRVDVTTIALGGGAAGMTLVGLAMLLLAMRS